MSPLQDAGSIIIDARDTVSFDGRGNNGRFATAAITRVEKIGRGRGGDIRINTQKLLLTNGAQLATNTREQGIGDAGNIIINASDTVSFNGTSSDGVLASTAISSIAPFGRGRGGDIRISSKSLSLTNGAQLVAATGGQGNAGNIVIDARDYVSFNGVNSNGLDTGASSSVESKGVGEGGNINITTRSLLVTNGAVMSVRNVGSGIAGKITVAARSVLLDNLALMNSDTVAGKGNIFLHSQNLVLRRGSNITTNATGTATGGNITIDTGVLAALENSDIRANAQAAFGGRVIIDTQGIFRTADSDITASSELGTEFNGTVDINTPGIEPNSGLINLPVQLVEARVAQTCQPSRNQAQSEFVVTGRGGLPPSPDETLSSDAVQVDWVTLNPKVENRNQNVSTITTPEPDSIVEATGWTIADNGDVILTASAPSTSPNFWQKAAECHTTRNSS